MHQEVDYVRELKNTEEFSALLKGDDRYVVPKVYPEYSSRRVLATGGTASDWTTGSEGSITGKARSDCRADFGVVHAGFRFRRCRRILIR